MTHWHSRKVIDDDHTIAQMERAHTKEMFSTTEEGLKHDACKQEWFAMPLEVLEPLADLFAAGEKKYSAFNCLNEFRDPSRRFYNAAMRHLRACQIDPLAKDPETGCYHAAAVAFSVLMRIHHCKEMKCKQEHKA